MRKIQLVTGQQIEAGQMGLCSVHEHILPFKKCPESKRQEAVDIAVKQLQRAYDLGLRTIVDVTPEVDAALLLEVARRSPMQIVAAPGFYCDFENKYKDYTVHDYFNRYYNCFMNGIDGTGVFPGALKVATDSCVLTESETRLLTAAGLAQKMSGLPLCVHSICATQEQLKVLTAAGADMSRTYFCHTEANQGWENRSFNEQVGLLEKIMDSGAFLCFNNFNNWTHTPEQCMADLINTFVRDGYSDHLLATMDYVWWYEGDQTYVLWQDICSDGVKRDYSYLVTNVLPWMRQNNIPTDAIHAMNHENPVKLFG